MHSETNDIDLVIGNVLRQTRLSAGYTLQALAERSGVTYQQIQKYETGANRLSVSRLVLLTNALGMTPAEFLLKVQAHIEDDDAELDCSDIKRHQFVQTETGRRVVSSIASIEDTAVLKSVLNLLTTIGNNPRM